MTRAGESAGAVDPERGALVGELARLRLPRTVGPRLSIDTDYRPCTTRPGDDGAIPRTVCDGSVAALAGDRRVLSLAARAGRAVRQGVDVDALHAAALMDLLWSSGTENSLTRSISYLRIAARLTDAPGPVLVDLAAALLVRAERTQNPHDLLLAVDAAARAVDASSHGAPALQAAARYDLALALERVGLDTQAATAWRRFLVADSTTQWARDARRRLPAPTRARADRAPSEAPLDPQRARELAMDSLLPRWGEATLAGQPAVADGALAQADAIGAALLARRGDASVADAVRAVRAARQDSTRRRLARAHRAYGAAQAAFGRSDFAAARRAFEEAAAASAATGDGPLRQWALVSRVAALVQLGLTSDAERASRRVVVPNDTVRYPALAGRARWIRGTALARSRRVEEAGALFRAAGTLFARAGEHENAGAVRFLVGDAERVAGDVDAMHASMYGALGELREHRESVWLHNLLDVWATAMSGEAPRAAALVQEEDVGIAAATGSHAYLAEAMLAQARLAVDAGDARRAADILARARPLLARLPAGPELGWVRADRQIVEGALSARTRPRRAIAALDSVVAFFDEIGNRVRLLPALAARAEARFAAGDAAAAESDLERAVALVEEQRDATVDVSLRASALDGMRRTVNQLVMRRVAAGRPADALAYMERSRLSFAPGRAAGRAQGRAEGRAARPAARDAAAAVVPDAVRREVAVQIALIGDTLLTWTVVGPSVELRRSVLDHARLATVVERLRSALELRAADEATRADLATLYDWLVRPIESRLGPDDTRLELVVDDALAGVPFAALRDAGHARGRGRYLIEAHPLRFATRLSDAPRDAVPSAPRTALLVADPAIDRRAAVDLAPLPSAAAEVAAIARGYAVPNVLAGAAASVPALLAALPDADVAHFAGHAVLDDDRPARSYLALAPALGASTPVARLTAADVAALDLRRVRLLVLSACQTSSPSVGRSGGFAGLTGAFLAAGVGGVVGTLWRVDDASTAPLMVDFHDAYRERGDGADALRRAQLRALRSADAARRSPAAWAGFRYVGG